MRSRSVCLTVLLALVTLAGCSAAIGQERTSPTPKQAEPAERQVHAAAPPRTSAGAPAGRPNIVLVLMDDFSMDLLQTMRGAKRLARKGASYDHFVVDSLCCVSRSSLMTGQYPHQTGVLTNTSTGALPYGGWPAFERNGNPRRSFNVRLQRSGYTTGFVGKYLNEYEYVPGRKPVPAVPPGWSQFNVLFGSAYDGWGFDSTTVVDGRTQVRHHAAPSRGASQAAVDAAYAGQVVEDYALDFIRSQRKQRSPYFLEVAPYAPHNRTTPAGAYPGDPIFPAAFRDRPGGTKAAGNCGPVACGRLTAARSLPGFGDKRRDNVPRTRNGRRTRPWNTVRTLPAAAATGHLRDRARMVQSIDRTLRKIIRAVDDNTYVILTSDNGFHLGQLGMGLGKGTAYDTDIRVPLLVTGPGVVRGKRQEMTSNIDLASTFEELAGLKPAPYRSGTSLVPTFADRTVRSRHHVFVEHTTGTAGGDPDRAFTGGELMRIPSYVAVRSRTGLLVRHDLDPSMSRTQHAYEFYSYAKHGWEKKNKYGVKKYADEVAALTRKLKQFDRCTDNRRNDRVTKRCRRLTR